MQALLLTLNGIAINLYVSDDHKSGQLLWEKPGDGYGFPLGPSLRKLAQGSDIGQ